MNLQITNARLIEEVKTLASLLKMKIRVESGSKDSYNKLVHHIDKIIALEEKAQEQSSYYNQLESEVQTLRKTCEKFSELSESVQLLHSRYKQQISQLNSEKTLMNEEIIDIRYLLLIIP
jgi:CII-binding regulator of phage lambda lysogenization HflD